MRDEGFHLNGVDESENRETSALVDPLTYVRTLYRRRWIVLGVFLAAVSLSLLHSLRQPKVYQAATSMIIDVLPPNVLDNQVKEVVESGAGGYWYNKDYYETQMKVMTSRSVASRVVEKLGLQHDPAFLGVAHLKSPEQRANAMKTMDAASILQGKVSATPVKESRVVNVIVQDGDPARAALLANEVAEAYISENISLKLKMTESASLWLEERLKTLEADAKRSEMAVYTFKKKSDVLETSFQDRQSMVSQRLNSYNTALTEVRTKIASLRARIDAVSELKSKADSEEWPLGIPSESQLIGGLKAKYAEQRTECAELRDRYLANHPKLQACEEGLKSLREDLFRELTGILAGTQIDLAEAINNERNLLKLFDAAKADAFKLNEKQLEFDRLKWESDNNQRLFDLVSKRLKDIELSGMLRTSNARILDQARPNPGPIRPRVFFNFLIAALFGLLGGIGAAFVIDLLDTRISTQEQIEQWLKVSFLGFVPTFEDVSTGGDPFVHKQPKSAVAECCRGIRTNLLFMSPDKPLHTILVTSSTPEEGKTTTSINLAATMAEGGNRVLLIDADMRRPRVHRAFNLPNGEGLSSLILGQGSVETAVKTTGVPNLWVLTSGPNPPNPSELLHTNNFLGLLQRLSERFDKIIIDSPPVRAVADAVVLSTLVDGTLLVLKTGRTSRDYAQRTLRALADVNGRVFGAVLTNFDVNHRGYYSSYEHHAQHGPADHHSENVA